MRMTKRQYKEQMQERIEAMRTEYRKYPEIDQSLMRKYQIVWWRVLPPWMCILGLPVALGFVVFVALCFGDGYEWLTAFSVAPCIIFQVWVMNGMRFRSDECVVECSKRGMERLTRMLVDALMIAKSYQGWLEENTELLGKIERLGDLVVCELDGSFQMEPIFQKDENEWKGVVTMSIKGEECKYEVSEDGYVAMLFATMQMQGRNLEVAELEAKVYGSDFRNFK